MSECQHNNKEDIKTHQGVLVVCHECKTTLGRKCEVYSRVVGYLRPTTQWNSGKKEEFKTRTTYSLEQTSQT